MENFIVSARKYRPATFESVVGQKHITSTLRNAIQRGQLAHAYLFCGPRGVGKTTCARIFAKAINCLDASGSEACNACESCRSFNEGRSLNIHELDAASNNSVEDIRKLIEQVRVIPQVGRYSVFIIDEVHMLSSAAFNAFLKTLEEPPKHAIFILATTEKHKIIPTILSRCQVYDFNRIRVEDAVEYLRYIANSEGVTSDDESLNLISQKADGGMRDALSMFDKAVSFCGSELRYQEVAKTLNVLDYDTYFSVVERVLLGSYQELLIELDSVLARGFSAQTFVAGLNKHLRDLLVAKSPQTLSLLEMTGSLLKRYSEQAAKCDVALLFQAIDIVTDLDGRLRQSSNQRLLVELGLMKICGLSQKKNGDTPTLTTRRYDLPELKGSESKQQGQSVEPRASEPRVTVESAAVAHKQPKVEAAVEPQAVQSRVTNVEPKPTTTAEHKVPPTPTTRSGLISIASLMGGGAAKGGEQVVQSVAGESEEYIAQTLESSRAKIVEMVSKLRPRFAAAFDSLKIEGSMLCVVVSSQDLHDELVRSKSELLHKIKSLCSLSGTIDIKVDVNEQIRASLPIRLEDRLAFLMQRNQTLQLLKSKLDLEAES